MRLPALAAIACAWTAAVEAQIVGSPIPRRSLNAEEVEDLVAKNRAAYERSVRSGELLEDELQRLRDNAPSYYTYRDSDVRARFPWLPGDAKRAYQCNIYVAQMFTLVYTSEQSAADRTVNVHELRCHDDGGNLTCTLVTGTAFYVDDPQGYFDAPGVDADEARWIIERYRTQRPDSEQVSRITRRGDGFVLHLGRDGCACWTDVTVRVRGTMRKRLEIDPKTDGACA